MTKFNLKKLTKDLVRDDILVPHIEIYQAKGEFPEVWNIEIRNTKEPDPYFHPSGDCFTDPHTLYLEKTGQVPKKGISFGTRRVFDCGHFWHGYYQNILVDMGFVKPENVEKTVVYKHSDHPLGGSKGKVFWIGKGTIDLYNVEIPGHLNPYIVDLKTMSDTEFDSGPRADTFKKWEAQLNCYMDWTGMRNAMILAVRKGGTTNKTGRPQHDLKEYRIQYKPELLAEIYERWELAQRYIDGKEVDTVS